jgi:hypothetical protein
LNHSLTRVDHGLLARVIEAIELGVEFSTLLLEMGDYGAEVGHGRITHLNADTSLDKQKAER